MYRQGCWPSLFGGSERSLAQIVKRLGRRGEIIRVVRGSTVVWAVMPSGLGEVERFGQWEEVGVVHRAARRGHGHGFNGSRDRLLLRCQESFLSFVFVVLLLWFTGGVVVLVGLWVRFTALNKNCGSSIYRQSVTIHLSSRIWGKHTNFTALESFFQSAHLQHLLHLFQLLCASEGSLGVLGDFFQLLSSDVISSQLAHNVNQELQSFYSMG